MAKKRSTESPIVFALFRLFSLVFACFYTFFARFRIFGGGLFLNVFGGPRCNLAAAILIWPVSDIHPSPPWWLARFPLS